MTNVTPIERRYAYYITAPQFRWLWKELGHEVARRTGLTPLLLVRTPEDRKFYEQQFGRPLMGETATDPDIYGFVLDDMSDESEKAENRNRAAAFERTHGITLLRDFLLAERQYARAYLTGAKWLSRTKISHVVNSDNAIKACLTAIDHYGMLFKKYPPGLVVSVSGGSCIMGKPLSLHCKANGVPFRNMTHSRFGSRYIWAEDEYGNASAISEAIRRYPAPVEADLSMVSEQITPTSTAEYYSKQVRNDIRWSRIAFRAGREIAAYVYRTLRGYTKSRYTYLTGDVIRQMVLARRQWKYLAHDRRPRLSELPERKLVFFPLQSEPEVSLTGLAPHFSNQLATIRELSLSLPADALLVVKEHPVQLCARGRDFYETIAALPNTVLVNIQESSYRIIEKSDLVVAVTSSAAHEAAVLGRKVIYLCPHGVLHAVPHVYKMNSFEDFEAIPDILGSNDAVEHHARRVEGARYFLALREASLDLDGMGQFDHNKVPTDEEIGYIAQSLIDSLERTDEPSLRQASS